MVVPLRKNDLTHQLAHTYLGQEDTVRTKCGYGGTPAKRRSHLLLTPLLV
jgi:hypothetical protein